MSSTSVQSENSADRTAGSVAESIPLVHELLPAPDVMAALRAFSDQADVLLMESTLKRDQLGRYSFLMADPFRAFEIAKPQYGSDPFAPVRAELNRMPARLLEGLPPFQGGAAGMLSYELGGAFERVPVPKFDEFQLPAAAIGFYDWVIAWDHATDRAWVISHGWPEPDINRRNDRAAQRLQWVLENLHSTGDNESSRGVHGTGETEAASRKTDLAPRDLARQWLAPGPAGLTSNFSHDGYLRAVQQVIDYIYKGDVFQVNLSQRLLYPARCSWLDLYERLRQCNPAPFAGFFSHDDWAVASASPERLVCVRGDEVESRPLKGTRQRRRSPEADLFTRDELRESEKDQAENVMIVDLLRNDLSRVCRPGSIRVPKLCVVEPYETVQHLVSEIRGTLATGSDGTRHDAWHVLRAVFPGGSITGAPKIRAMEIISEMEPTARGPYCGSLFYVGFDGQCDSNILIRTFTCRRGWIQCQVGGGIVAQSNPQAEYEETQHKAAGMLRALVDR